MAIKLERFNFLRYNHTLTLGQDSKWVAYAIYRIAAEKHLEFAARRNDGQVMRNRDGSIEPRASNPKGSLQTQLSPDGRLAPAVQEAICVFFGIPEEIWGIDDDTKFVEQATTALRVAGNLADPRTPLRPVAVPRTDIWGLKDFGRPVQMGLAPLAQDAALMFFAHGEGPEIPTFRKDDYVRLSINLDFPARLRLIHVDPERSAFLVGPSVFIPDERLPPGLSVLPTASPANHPLAFAIHEPIGLHYLLAVAVAEDAEITLPAPDPKLNRRAISESELDTLGRRVFGLKDPALYGVGVVCFQVAPRLNW